jgi:hypothetical protein
MIAGERRCLMAVGMLMQIPEGTQELYDGVMEAMEWESRPLPDGLVAHFAGPSEEGWFVFDVWESQEAFHRFADERLKPAFQQVTDEAPAMSPQFIPLHNQIGVMAHA